MTAVNALTRDARIRCLSTEQLAEWIDRLLDMRLGGADPVWCDPELADLRAEQRRRNH